MELDGRRLIIKEQVSKEEAAGLRDKQKAEEKQKKEDEDKRNVGMAKEGLLNEHAWINQGQPLSKAQSDLRQRLYISKQKALKASTNLYVSKTRLQIRNLPRRDFFEPELKQLMLTTATSWSKTLTKEEYKAQYKNKKLILQIKVMRDEQKTDATGESLASGMAFVEFKNEALALYAVRFLNNMELTGKNRGLVVDFSMEDQRALFKRKEKIEKWRKIAKEEKEKNAAESKPVKRSAPAEEGPLDLGAYWRKKQEQPDEREDEEMKDESEKKMSRGQRQRM